MVALRRLLITVAGFCAVTAIAGGVAVAANLSGAPHRYLDDTPFTTFLVPGLVLALVVGGTQLVAAVAVTGRTEHALLWAAVAGLGMQIWITLEVMTILEFSFLQPLYFALGTAELVIVLLLLGVHRSTSARGAPAGLVAPSAKHRLVRRTP